MRRGGVFISILISLFAIFLMLIVPHTLTGFTVYSNAPGFCGKNISDNSSFSAAITCNPGVRYGGTINETGIEFNCNNFALSNGGGISDTFGFKTNTSSIIKNCNIYDFDYDINVTGSAIVIDSVLSSAITKEAVITSGSYATFLNVSFTDANVDVQGTANISVQYYVVANVTNATGAAVSGATVCVNATGAAATNICGTTDASGFAYFNVTDYFKTSGGNTDYIYSLNATKTGYNTGQNISFNLTATSGRLFVPMNISPAGGGDSTPPAINFTNPTTSSGSYTNSTTSITANVTASDAGSGLDTITVYLSNSTGLYNLSISHAGSFFLNYSYLPAGNYTLNASANDTAAAANINWTETRWINLTAPVSDTTPPMVTINSPNGTYTVHEYTVNITLNEAGTCLYSLDSGATNNTMTANASNTGFTASTTAVNGNYVLNAYCNDTAGNRNNTMNVSFTINHNDGGGGGGGGGCDVESWDCGAWGVCQLPPGSARVGVVWGEQTRTCTSNCDTQRTETQVCNVTFPEECENQCDGIGDRCNGNSVESCELVDGCYKIVNIEDCGSSHRCEGGVCIEIEQNKTNPIEYFSNFVSDLYGHSDLPRPSDFIPGPPIVVNTASAAAGVSLLWLLIWLIWMLASVPFFLRRLKHYSISIFDSANELKIFHPRGGVDNGRLLEFLKALQKSYGRLVFAEKDSEMIKYLVEDGFIEVRLDRPFVVMGHFSDDKHAKIYGQVMKNVLERFKAGSVKVMSTTEKTTIFRALRAYLRERKAKKMFRRAFRK